jgi:hypothetical protein
MVWHYLFGLLSAYSAMKNVHLLLYSWMQLSNSATTTCFQIFLAIEPILALRPTIITAPVFSFAFRVAWRPHLLQWRRGDC